MSLDHMAATSTRILTAENHAHAPLNDWETAALAGIGECNDPAHLSWESAWIDIGGEG